MSVESIEPKQFPITLGMATLAVVVWGIAAWLVLQLQFVTFGTLHGICGPWGCGPPISVLTACHGFWLIILGPPTCFGCSVLNPGRLLKLGIAGLTIGLLAMSGIAVWEATHWLSEVTEYQRGYFLQRWLFAVAVNVDFPIFELTLFSLSAAICGWMRMPEACVYNSRDSVRPSSQETQPEVMEASPTNPIRCES